MMKLVGAIALVVCPMLMACGGESGGPSLGGDGDRSGDPSGGGTASQGGTSTTTPTPSTPPETQPSTPPPTVAAPSSGGGGSNASGGGPGQCEPDAACGGLSSCTDHCYGDRCCYLGCGCDSATGRLRCSMSCS
jgi:hypothetical protein